MIGMKRERIEIQVPTTEADSEGQPIKDWAKHCETWASVRPLTGREYESMRQINSEISKVFEMNYRREMVQRQQDAEVSAVKMRIVWVGDNWNIHDIQPDEEKFNMKIFAARVK